MKKTLVALVVVAAAVAGGGAYLFRSRTIDGGEKGQLTAHFRWGYLKVVEYDTNRDGMTDTRDILAPGAAISLPETWRPMVSIMDLNHDGVVDVEVESRTRDGISATIYWIDTSGDGTPDEALFGEEGRRHVIRMREEVLAAPDVRQSR